MSIFSPLLSSIEYSGIERKRKQLILKDAKLPNSDIRENFSIPLDPNGCILINYRKGTIYDSFNNEPVIGLVQLDEFENQILSCLNNILIDSVLDEQGFEMQSTVECKLLLSFYD